MSKFTPGPWVNKANREVWSVGILDTRIATIDGAALGNPGNANLIAAAPQLLAACQRAIYGGELDEKTEAGKEILRAIAMAEGRKDL